MLGPLSTEALIVPWLPLAHWASCSSMLGQERASHVFALIDAGWVGHTGSD
jgi:hypothetical protein